MGCALVGCAAAPPPKPQYVAEHQPTFEGFRGAPLSVVVIDKAPLFSDAPEVLELAKQSVEQELARRDVVISADSERRLVFEVHQLENKSTEQAMLECVRVVGYFESRSQQFLPSSQYGSSVCEGNHVNVPTRAVDRAAPRGVHRGRLVPEAPAGFKRSPLGSDPRHRRRSLCARRPLAVRDGQSSVSWAMITGAVDK